MLAHPVRAIYEHGHLGLLDPVDLPEGQEIQVMIVSEQERVRVALADILMQNPPNAQFDETIDEAALLAELDAETMGKPSMSDAIIEERREGP